MGRIRGYLYLAVAFMLAGSSVVAARFLSGKLDTFTIAAATLLLSLLALLPLCWSTAVRAVSMMGRRDWASIFFQALLGMFLFRMFLLLGLQQTSAGEAGILTGAAPALTVVLAWLILRETMPMVRVMGILSTIAGVLIIQGILSSSLDPEHLLGNLLVLAAALCESLFNILSRATSIAARHGSSLDPVAKTMMVTGIAFLLCIIPCILEQPVSALLSLDLPGWIALLWYGLIVTALGYICWYAGISRCSASVAAAFSGLMPVTAMALSFALLGEHLKSQHWLGAAMVILGMLLTSSDIPDQRLTRMKSFFSIARLPWLDSFGCWHATRHFCPRSNAVLYRQGQGSLAAPNPNHSVPCQEFPDQTP